MIETGPIWLLRPWWLAALLALLPAAFLLWRRRAEAGAWARHVDPDLMSAMRQLGHVVSTPATATIVTGLCVAFLAITALSGPAQRDTSAPSFSNLEGIVTVVDMSPSVARSSALDDAKAAAAEIVQSAGGRAVALIAFAAEAYAISALTDDPASLETPIAMLASDTMPDAGSRPDRGLELALAMLRETGVRGGDIVLISDGGGLGPIATRIARDIARSGARLHAIAVRPEEPVYGMPPPNGDALEGLSRAGGGGMLTIPGIDTAMAAGRSGVIADNALAQIAFRDLGRTLLALALLPALLLFRRRR